MPFLFEKLAAYQKAVQWMQTADDLIQSLRSRSSPNLLDQLSRASLSISLNIAEGNGRWHKADKRQFFWIARGSAFECVPILQVLRQNGQIEEERYLKCYRHLEELAKMLSGLINSVEDLPKTDNHARV